MLFKASNAAQLGTSLVGNEPSASSHEVQNPLFLEPTKPVDAIPAPRLFLDVIQHQWTSPGTAPAPSSSDRRFFNLVPEMATLLQVPSVDPSKATLLPNSAILGNPEEGLWPEDRRSDQVLKRVHQGAAWAIQSATTVSFFNRATLFWQRQCQNKL